MVTEDRSDGATDMEVLKPRHGLKFGEIIWDNFDRLFYRLIFFNKDLKFNHTLFLILFVQYVFVYYVGSDMIMQYVYIWFKRNKLTLPVPTSADAIKS